MDSDWYTSTISNTLLSDALPGAKPGSELQHPIPSNEALSLIFTSNTEGAQNTGAALQHSEALNQLPQAY